MFHAKVCGLLSAITVTTVAATLVPSQLPAQHEGHLRLESVRGSTAEGLGGGKIPIFQLPFKIDAPGSYYVVQDLTVDLNQSPDGILVNVDDVTINLCGYTLRGLANSGDGIRLAANTKNVCIYGGIIRDWTDDGIDAENSDNLSLHDTQADR